MTVRPLVWLHTLADVRYLPVHDLGALVREDRLNDLETLTFTIRADDPKAFAVQPDRLVEFAGRYYRVEELHDFRDGSGKPFVEAYCEARWMDLGKRSRAGNYSIIARTPLQGLTTILSGTGWTGFVDTIDPALYSMEDIDASVLTLLRRWASIVGQEVEFDTAAKTVTLVDQLGQDRGIGFRYGYNLRTVDRRYRPPTATRLYPFGANDLNISGPNPSGLTYIEDYSWYTAQGLTLPQAQAYRKDEVWYDARYLVAVILYDAAVRRLAQLAQPTISYELSVADFSTLTGSTADDVEMGDIVRVRDPDFSIDITTRVVRLVEYPLRPQDNEVELDYLQPGLSEVNDSESTRQLNYSQLSLLVDQNADALTVTSGTTVWGTIAITVAGSSTTFAAGGTFRGVATGTGTVRFGLYLSGTLIGEAYDFAFVAGQVEFSWPTMETGIAEGSYSVEWRAQVVSGSGTIDVAAEACRAWIISQGTVGGGGAANPSQLLTETILDVDPALWLSPSDEWTYDVTDIDGPPGDPDMLIEVAETITDPVDPLLFEALSEDWISDLTPLLSFVGATTPENFGAGDSITTIDVVVPATSEEFDLIAVALMQQAGSSDVTAPAGFTRVGQQVNVGGNQWTELWTIDDDGTMAGDTLTFTTTTPGRLGAMCFVLRDSDAVGVVVEQVAGTNYNSAAGVEPFASVTSAGLGRLAVAISSCTTAGTGSTTYSTPSGYTQMSRPTAGDTPTHERNRLSVSRIATNAATLSGRSTTHSGATHDAATLHVLFRPA